MIGSVCESRPNSSHLTVIITSFIEYWIGLNREWCEKELKTNREDNGAHLLLQYMSPKKIAGLMVFVYATLP